jgi:hypothetical protein
MALNMLALLVRHGNRHPTPCLWLHQQVPEIERYLADVVVILEPVPIVKVDLDRPSPCPLQRFHYLHVVQEKIESLPEFRVKIVPDRLGSVLHQPRFEVDQAKFLESHLAETVAATGQVLLRKVCHPLELQDEIHVSIRLVKWVQDLWFRVWGSSSRTRST